MRKSIRNLVISIILVCSILIISIPFWNIVGKSNIGSVWGEYDLPIAYKVGVFESLLISDDENALNIVSPSELVLKNRNGFIKTGKIYALVEKKSTISYEYIRVSLDEEVYNLNESEIESDDKYYYFYLKDIELDSYKEESIMTRIWLSKDISEISADSLLIMNIIVR